jgi:hypothetical protein
VTTRTEIKEWLEEAESDATHMLVVCDMFDYSDYPVYVSNVKKAIKHYDYRSEMSKVMEVYDLRKDFDEQLNEYRAWNF